MMRVDIVLPVYNEEKDLPGSVGYLVDFLQGNLSLPWHIVIADNGSTDGTLARAQALAQEYPQVGYIHLPEKGRGRALKAAWLKSEADILSYMDIDLSTDLAAFPLLVQAILDGYDLAIGSRLLPGSKVVRSLRRELISRSYNLLIRALFFTRFSDAQCGFKAISRRAARALLPLVVDNGWFLDTELLILGAKNGYRIKEVPVAWVEDPDSRVKVLRTAWGDLKGLLRLRLGGVPRVG